MLLDQLTIQYWLQKHATYRPQHTALVFEDKRISYAQLYAQVNRLCHAMAAAGVGKGDKVATLLANSVELWEVYWACAAMGAVAVPLSPLLRGNGLVNLVENADVKLLITYSGLVSVVNDMRDRVPVKPEQCWLIDQPVTGYTYYREAMDKQPDTNFTAVPVTGNDPYNIIYSSGTTGLPKGIVISHAVRALYGSLFANAYRMTPESVVMHSGSIIFNGSFLTLMPAMFLGCTYVLMSHFDSEDVIQVIRQEKVTHTILVPSQIVSCMQHDDFRVDELPSLEYILSVGAPLLLEQKHELNRRLPNVFYELYGLTEGFMTILDKNDALRKVGSVGFPPAFMDIRIVDEDGQALPTGTIGEIIGRSPLLMSEYYKNPSLTAEAIRNGWLYTGDMGYVDEEGFLFLTGRKKELIISGGVNIYPADIEQVLIRHDAVFDVAVFGIPHPQWGETPVAAVVLKSGLPHPDAQSICDWANRHMEARYQKLSAVFLLDELPRNVAGKVLKQELKLRFTHAQ